MPILYTFVTFFNEMIPSIYILFTIKQTEIKSL
jgi:hypothetical protein